MGHLHIRNKKLPKKWHNMKDYTDKKWMNLLNRIECKILRSKIASLVYWDHISFSLAGLKSPVKDLMQEYSFSQDWSKIPDEKVEEGLKVVGYPTWLAKQRSITPKDHRSDKESRERRNKKRREERRAAKQRDAEADETT